jgi:putative glutamine amidotransferase
MTEKHPRILVSAALSHGVEDTKSSNAIMASLRALGAEPVFVGNHADLIAEYGSVQAAVEHKMANADGIILMGNNDDIDPAKYGQTPHAKTQIETNLHRAAFEETLIINSLKHRVPLLGICGGMQRINVLLGGTLNQHVDGHHQGHTPGFQATQKLLSLAGTKLQNVMGEHAMENSFHHQAIEKLGQGLRLNAQALDGTPKGFETDPTGVLQDQYIMGVQWHPEFGASDASTKVIADVVNHAKAHMKAEPLPTLQCADSVQRSAHTRSMSISV